MPRQSALLVVETQQLERLLEVTPPSAPDRGVMLRRLAENYVELSRSLARDGKSGAPEARAKAIACYDRLVREVPAYPQIDEALYFAGLERELGGDWRSARATYYDLIKRAPNSKYIPHAYFAFGEMFFDEAKSDPAKLDLASQAFLEVVKYPAPQNGVMADALLRLGQIADAKGNAARAANWYQRLKRDFPASEAAAAAP